jgi:uncharacterized protein
MKGHMKYTHRALEKQLKSYLSAFPVIGITGPRQSGKSTMLQHVLKDEYTYVTFDDYKIISFFYDDPEKFMQTYNNKIIFDEVQKIPEIFSYIKMKVDKDRQNYGKFILTGSSQFSFLKNISESLAGRMGLLSLLPFQLSETPPSQRHDAIYQSSYPELVLRNYNLSSEWYSSYLETYLDKDIRQLFNIGDLRDFRRFISLLATKASNILNMTSFSNDLGVTVSTIKRWLSILEASYIIFFVPAYYNNFGKRITKSPKVYFYDTGLITYLVGIDSKTTYEKGPLKGPIFENFIISEILKKNMHAKKRSSLYYFRTSGGDEIDIIEEEGNHKNFIEIKSSSTFKTQMTKNIEKYKKTTDKGYLVYQGENFPYTHDVKVLNYENYLKHYS